MASRGCGFLSLVGLSVWVLGRVGASASVSVFVSLGTVFVSGVVGGVVVNRREANDPAAGAFLVGLMWLSVAGLFKASTELEPAAWWAVWFGLVLAGVYAGTVASVPSTQR